MERFLVHETAIHWIDTFRFLIGEPSWVFADLRRINPVIRGEDAGFLIFGYANGARALFDGNRLADHVAENRRRTMGELLIEGSKASLRLDGEGRLSLRDFGSNDWRDVDCEAPVEGFGGDAVYALQKHVTDHLLRGTPVENTAADYIRNIEIENAAYLSAEQGRRISLPARSGR
jgi:predicted dehydrogenase